MIYERFHNYDYNMKLCIKEKMCEIAHKEIFDMTPPLEPIKTKCALKKIKQTPNNSSTKQSSSFHDYVDSLYPDTLISQ